MKFVTDFTLASRPLRVGRAGAPPAPFVGLQSDIWLDPSDLTTLFQDAAGTTPVTTAGQSVALIRDKSGKGNHGLQAVVARRPIYRVDEAGNGYLEGDGIDDNIIGTMTVPFGPGWTICAALRRGANTGMHSVLGVQSDGNINNYLRIRADSSERLVLMTRVLDADIDRVTTTSANGSFPGTGTSIVSVFLRATPGNNEVRINGTLATALTTPSNWPASLALGASIKMDVFGDFPASANQRFYGMMVFRRILSAAETAATEAYLAARSGVTL